MLEILKLTGRELSILLVVIGEIRKLDLGNSILLTEYTWRRGRFKPLFL